jgi:hypothetical protein
MTFPTGPGANPLTPDQITFAVDWMDREVALVPDPVARRMELERKHGWVECAGFAYGNSRPFPPGTWMHQVFTTLITVYAASPVPELADARDREQAEADRWWANHRELRLTVVGESDFDPQTRRWRDFPASTALHPFGWAHQDPPTGAYVISG